MLWDYYDPWRFNPDVPLDLSWRIVWWGAVDVGLEDGNKKRKTKINSF